MGVYGSGRIFRCNVRILKDQVPGRRFRGCTSYNMKTSLIPSLLAGLAISMAAPLHAEAAASVTLRSKPTAQLHGEIAVDSVDARIHANGDSVTCGTSRVMVSMRLGSPNAVLPDGSWLYRGYTGEALAEPENGPRAIQQPTLSGTLIVRFRDGKVTSLGLADTFTPQS